MKTTQAGLARICGVSRSAIWYRVQKGHLRQDENGLLDVTRARRALQRSGSRIIIPYNERELLEIEKLKLQTYKLRKQIDELEVNLIPVSEIKEIINLQLCYSMYDDHLFRDGAMSPKQMYHEC